MASVKSTTKSSSSIRPKKRQQQRLTSFFTDDRETSRTATAGGHDNNLLTPPCFTNQSNHQHVQCTRSRPLWNDPSKKRRVTGESGFGVCPLCETSFPWHKLESHAAGCSGIQKRSNVVPSVSSSDQIEVTVQQNQTTTGTTTMRFTENHSGLESSSVVGPIQPPFTTLKSSLAALNDGVGPKLRANSIQPTSEPIPGLFLYEDFITKEEEDLILQGLDHADTVPWKSANFNGRHLGKRWGVHCNLRDRRVDSPEHSLPNVIQQIILPKLKSLSTMKGCIPNEANAIDYRRSQGHWLQAHVDDRKLSKECIANLSLVGECYMTFENRAMHRNLAVPQQKVLLPRRCLQVLTGKARYDFSHAIAHQDLLTDRRVSITLRESPLTVVATSSLSQAFPAITPAGTGDVQDLLRQQDV